MTYFLKKPKKGQRATFALILRETLPSGMTSQKTIKDNDDIVALNASLLTAAITLEHALKAAKVLVSKLNFDKKKARHPDLYSFHPFNMQIVEKYLEEVYDQRDIFPESLASITSDLRRAVLALGQMSLQTSSRKELQTQLNGKLTEVRKQRRAASRINSLLKYINRGFKLNRMKETLNPVHHVSEQEMLTMCEALKDQRFALMCKVAYYSGLRLGELMTINTDSLKNNQHLYVFDQIVTDGSRRQTKTKKPRNAIIIPHGVEFVREWCELPTAEKMPYRFPPRVLSKTLGRRMCVHDLRHSYARWLADHNLSLSEIAEYLGNSVGVCEKHYKGWVRSEFAIDARFKQLVAENEKKS
jgi:integrase